MSRFRHQLLWGSLWLVLMSGLALRLHSQFRQTLPNYNFVTGWTFLAVMVLLALYNGRKKLPFLPLGKSETWLQIHIYAGFFTVILFLIHLNFRLPRAWFGNSLALLYLLVTGSGIAGLILSRVVPRRLSTRGGEVIYEKIPALRYGLQQQAEALAVGPEAKSPALADFYVRKLAVFFTGRQNFWLHLLESRRPVSALLTELDDLKRYLDDKERPALERLAQLVRQKDGLDYHDALQTSLKLWLFVHLPLTYSLMIFSVLHVALVFAFSGGAR
ncbi:MAG TPA: hypothetical protein VMZ27_06960 [Candidatus Saccharimonadales bacterium]|nr:hypothetical protein [Candidatus Saccharimonadales bacterium]